MKSAVLLACAALAATGCASEPKADISGTGPKQQFVGQSDTIEMTVKNEDTKVFPSVAIEFEQQAWTVQDVQPDGTSFGGGTYGIGELGPGETVEIVATLVAHTPGNQPLVMNLYGDARPDGIQLDYLGTLEFEVAVAP